VSEQGLILKSYYHITTKKCSIIVHFAIQQNVIMLTVWTLFSILALVSTYDFKPNINLRGKVALVTGASRGIGKGIAIGIAEAGAKVFITGRSKSGYVTEAKLGGTIDDVVKEIKNIGGDAVSIVCDHRNDTRVKEVFDFIEQDSGRLDIVVNNAFQIPSSPTGEEDKELLFRNFWEQPGERKDCSI
jgi:NADPH:quinone reductase-like Zn-dependent oxidoreductase